MRGMWLMLAAIVCFYGGTGKGVAQQIPTDVAFGGEFFFRFRATAGGLSPVARAVVLQGRWLSLFTRLMVQKHLLRVDTYSQGEMCVIVVAGVPFVTVTVNDARANGTTVKGLAAIWAFRLQEGLHAILSQ